MRSRGWVPTPIGLVPCTEDIRTDTEGRPCGDTGRRQSSAPQGERGPWRSQRGVHLGRGAGPAGRRGVAAVFKPRHRRGAFLSAPELSLPVPRLCRVHLCCFQPPLRGPCHNIPGSRRTRRPAEFGRPCLGLGRVPQVAQRLLFSAAFSPVPVHALASSTGARRPHGPRITAVTKPPGVPAVTPSPRLAPVLHPTSHHSPGWGAGPGTCFPLLPSRRQPKGSADGWRAVARELPVSAA